jgi:hypothetical protein
VFVECFTFATCPEGFVAIVSVPSSSRIALYLSVGAFRAFAHVLRQEELDAAVEDEDDDEYEWVRQVGGGDGEEEEDGDDEEELDAAVEDEDDDEYE